MKTIAIYHKNCSDGTGAAAVVLKKYPDALLFPLGHGATPEELAPILSQAAIGDRIFTVDCTIGAKELLAAGHKVTSIDHHAGIEAESKALAASDPAFAYIFDNSHSGAALAWLTLFPDQPMPEIIRYIEDADLWKWQFGQTSKDVNNYLFMLQNQPQATLALFDADLSQIRRDGAFITKYIDIVIDTDIKDVEPIALDIIGHRVLFYNITHNKSDVGNLLATQHDRVVGLFTIKGQQVTISMRSLDQNAPSALDIAKALGGGGHRNAAGVRMGLEDFLKLIVHNP